MDFLAFDIVKVVFFVSVPAKALTRWADHATVLARIQISPIHIESVCAGLPYLSLICLEFSLAHHFATISLPDDIVVLDIGLHVLGCLTCHHDSLHHLSILQLLN